MTLVLAVDLGGSGLKAGLFAPDGTMQAAARVPLFFDETAEGGSQADPEDWWRALCTAVEEIAASGGDLDGVGMVATCGFTRTQVFLDAEGKPLRPALSFRDRRAAQVAGRMRDILGGDINAFHPLARLGWLRDEEPQHWHRLACVLEPKDYLNLRLTGRLASDEISMRWLAEAFAGDAARVGLDRPVLPDLGQPLEVMGQVRPGLPGAMGRLAGAGVMLGANDTWMAVAGMGALQPGRGYCISGSSEVFGVLSAHRAQAPGLVTIEWGRDLWHLGGPGQNGSNVLDWADGVLSPDTRETGTPLLFLPFLLGERVPFWDSDLRAALIGADAQSTSADIRRAAMEGVAFLNRTVLERAEAAAGLRVEAIRIGGGGARNDAWNHIRANVMGRTILASPLSETGLAGCHAAARVALGEAPDLSAAGAVLPPFRRFEPDPGRRDHYDALFDLFTQAHEALAPISRRLAGLARKDGDRVEQPRRLRE